MAEKAKNKIETPDVTTALRSALSDLIPIEKLATTVAEGLDALDTQIFLTSRKGAKHTKFADRDLIAWSERRQYAALAAKLLGVKGMNAAVEIEGDGKKSKIRVVVLDC